MASSITGADEIPTSRSSYIANSDTLINMTETGVLMPNTRPSVSTIDHVTICPIPFILPVRGKFNNMMKEENNCIPSVKALNTAM